MNKIINIKNKKAIDEIKVFKDKVFVPIDVKFENTHLKELNKLIGRDLFSKNDLYINSVTLWELMQPLGNAGSHNYHELTPEDIYYALNDIAHPECVIKAKNERYAIIPTYVSSFNEPLMIVIQLESGLIDNKNAKINKIITIYPKSNLEDYLNKMDENDILYKKMSINTGSNCLN